MDPHNVDEGLRTRAIERCRLLLARDPELQRVAPSQQARDRLEAEGTGSLRCAALACELYADRPAFGERATVVENGRMRVLPSLRYLTYADLWARVRAFAAGLRHLGIADTGAIVGLCGFASIDWVVADLACLYLGAVSVPLQTAAAAAELRGIVAEARLSAVVSSLAQLELCATAITGLPSVQGLVVMDVCPEDRTQAKTLATEEQRIAGARGTPPGVWSVAEVERAGRERGAVPPVDPIPGAVLRSIVYTSGSTGSPKGAMFPESLWTHYWQAIWPWDIPEVPYVGVNYMPLNHMAGRGGIIRSIISGGVTTFVHAPDMSTLFEDIRLARPTSLFLVPRAANMIHQHFQTEVVRRGVSEAQVMTEMRRTFLGDRLVYVVTGTAPTAPEVVAFIERAFEVPVIDGYGSTEAGAITIENRIARDNVIAYDLVDVPELGYTKADKPHPRGELRVKVRRAIPGYYQNPEATAVLFDDEGYLRTGDIVEERGPDEVVWIDRKKNVLKLSQGEFVSTSRLEELLSSKSPYIRQIYVHGNSLHSYLLAVVVPEGSADKALLRREIDRIAAQEGLKGYEVPRDFLIADEPFSRENGLLTESNKPSRHRIRARYGERLEALFSSIERAQLEELYALHREQGDDRPAQEKIARALSVTLGLSEIEPDQQDLGFVQLGGDSLGGVRFAGLIEDLTGVHVPVAMVLDPSSSVRSLARYVEERKRGDGGGPKRPSFAEVHGAGATTVKAEDLRVERFLDAADLAAKAPAEALPPPKVVLLTGANGFLGRFLLLELLARVPRAGGKVVAIVRAPFDEAARERLAAAYAGVDPTLSGRFAQLAGEGRLEVVAGDLIKPRLGLSEARWEALGGEVDAIVHNGALVNHAFSYAQLFEPNVLGTAELMRLAVRRRFASIGFVSSVGVAGGLDRAEPIREDEDAATLFRERPVNTGYAVGYGTSKWADEILLQDLEAKTGVPVTVFRCSMMLPPSSYVGQVNTGDFLTRLLESVVGTGLAPRSFYADPAAPHAFDGLPVDFVARSIASVSLERRPGFATCHVVASRRDGPSLDTIVDWVARAGYQVDRSLDHAAWLRAFGDRLRALPLPEQQRSALPVLHQWERPLGRELAFDNRCLRARIEALTPGEPPAIPIMDEMFVRQYLKNMVYLRLIGHPPLSTAA